MERKGAFRTQIVDRDESILSDKNRVDYINKELRKRYVEWAYDVFYFASNIGYKVTFSPLKLTRHDDVFSASVAFVAESYYEMHF